LETITLPEGPFSRVGPLAFNESWILVLENNYVAARIDRNDVKALRLERRSSFKHPVLGVAFGIAMILPAVGYLFDLVYAVSVLPRMFGKLTIGVVFLALGGAYLLYGCLTRRDIPWLLVTTNRGEKAFGLEDRSGPEVEALLQSLARR